MNKYNLEQKVDPQIENAVVPVVTKCRVDFYKTSLTVLVMEKEHQ